jgi:hypothetical protein
MVTRAAFPDAQVSFLTPSGKVSQPWRQLLLSLFVVTGGGDSDFNPTELKIAIAEAIQQISGFAMPPLVARAALEEILAFVPTHGRQEDETLHALVTSTAAGFMSAADKVKLDGTTDPREDIFVEGTDFAGGATSLTLTRTYASKFDVLVHFGAAYQGTDQYNVSGSTLSIPGGIPTGTGTVYARPR